MTVDLAKAIVDGADEPDDRTEEPPVHAVDGGEPTTFVDRLRARVLTAAQVEHLPAPEYLIDDLVVRNTFVVMFGKPGGGKSFVALDWAASVATGTWWLGHRVTKGRVLYIAAEGLAGLGNRVRAWKTGHNVLDVVGLTFLAGAVNLLQRPDTIALTTIAKEIAPVLIVVDTLGRSMAGGDENGPKDMGLVVEHIDQLRTETGATVGLVHHATKADGTLRGHTALEGAADTVIEVKGAEQRLLLTVTKQKDDRRPPPLHLHLVPVDDSCVLSDRAAPGDESAVTDQAREVLDILTSAALDDGLSSTDWLTLSIDQGIAKSSFFKHRKTLVSTGLVHVGGTDARPRYRPVTSANGQTEEEF